MHSFYAFRTKTVKYIIILASLFFKLLNEAGSNIQVVRVQCNRKLIIHAEKVAYVQRGGRVRKFGIRREKLRKTMNTCYFLQEPQRDYKLTTCQTRPSFIK
jgi:hypothetical protein